MKETKVYVDEFENIDQFCSMLCNCCTSLPDGYCPTECNILEKARKIPFEKIVAKWIEHDGDIPKIARYIRQYNLYGKRNKEETL